MDSDVSLDRLCDRDRRGRPSPALAAALDVGGVEPDVGEPVPASHASSAWASIIS